MSFEGVSAIIISYLIGSLSFSTLMGRWVGHIDIRQHGSGNAGATNTLRVLGLKWGLVVLVLDIAKGIIVIIGARLLPDSTPLLVYICGLSVIAGHNWPLFFKFRGGKGVATTIGVLFVSFFYPALIAGIFALTLVILTRFVSLGSLTFTTLVAILTGIMYSGVLPVAFAAVITVFSILRHRQNIVRLWRGTEHRVFENKDRQHKQSA